MTNSRIKKIFLHIGLNKTATTSIQESLFSSREVLLNEGYYYPDFTNSGIKHINHNEWLLKYCKSDTGNLIDSFIEGDKLHVRIPENKKPFQNSLIKQLMRFPNKKLILSAEELLALNVLEISNMKSLLEELTDIARDIEVIVFVRHPVYHAQSVLQQGVKMGFDTIQRNTKILIKSSNTRYRKTLDKFIQFFGESSLKVYRFEDAIQHPYGPSGMFLSIIGFPEEKMGLIKQIKSNESLSNEAVRILSAFNERHPQVIQGKRNKQRDEESIIEIAKLPGQKFSFSPDDQKRIWMNSEEDRNWLINNFNLTPYEFSCEIASANNNIWGIETLKQLEKIIPGLSAEVKSIVAQVMAREISKSDQRISNESRKLMRNLISGINQVLPVMTDKTIRRLVLIHHANFNKYFEEELSNPSICMISDGMFEIHPVDMPFVLNLPKVIKSFESKTFIILNIYSSKKSIITLEYSTDRNTDFDNSTSLTQAVYKGMNNIEFEFADFDFNGKTRLVFTDCEVSSRIQSIEIKTDALSYEDLFEENERMKKQIESLEKTRANFYSRKKAGLSLFCLKVRNLLNNLKSQLF